MVAGSPTDQVGRVQTVPPCTWRITDYQTEWMQYSYHHVGDYSLMTVAGSSHGGSSDGIEGDLEHHHIDLVRASRNDWMTGGQIGDDETGI